MSPCRTRCGHAIGRIASRVAARTRQDRHSFPDRNCFPPLCGFPHFRTQSRSPSLSGLPISSLVLQRTVCKAAHRSVTSEENRRVCRHSPERRRDSPLPEAHALRFAPPNRIPKTHPDSLAAVSPGASRNNGIATQRRSLHVFAMVEQAFLRSRPMYRSRHGGQHNGCLRPQRRGPFCRAFLRAPRPNGSSGSFFDLGKPRQQPRDGWLRRTLGLPIEEIGLHAQERNRFGSERRFLEVGQ